MGNQNWKMKLWIRVGEVTALLFIIIIITSVFLYWMLNICVIPMSGMGMR